MADADTDALVELQSVGQVGSLGIAVPQGGRDPNVSRSV